MSSKLPIYVRQEVLDENPHFTKLLEDIATQHLNPDGVDKLVREQCDKVIVFDVTNIITER